jgi:argininosuccinate lyase
LPLAYNKDLQEDKEPIFDLFETVIDSVDVLVPMIRGMKAKKDKMAKAASDGFLLATDLADWLVRAGVDFRASHEVTAQVVRYGLESGKDLKALTLEELKKFSPKFTQDVFRILDEKDAVNNRRTIGGTSKVCVLKEIKRIKKRLG